MNNNAEQQNFNPPLNEQNQNDLPQNGSFLDRITSKDVLTISCDFVPSLVIVKIYFLIFRLDLFQIL